MCHQKICLFHFSRATHGRTQKKNVVILNAWRENEQSGVRSKCVKPISKYCTEFIKTVWSIKTDQIVSFENCFKMLLIIMCAPQKLIHSIVKSMDDGIFFHFHILTLYQRNQTSFC